MGRPEDALEGKAVPQRRHLLGQLLPDRDLCAGPVAIAPGAARRESLPPGRARRLPYLGGHHRCTGGISGKGAHMGLGVLSIDNSAAAGVAVPPGSFGWDSLGTRRFWVVPSLNAIIIMLLPSGNGPIVHREIEKIVVDAFSPR